LPLLGNGIEVHVRLWGICFIHSAQVLVYREYGCR
jgi:hypothetical protein